jgi:hypothetical protein
MIVRPEHACHTQLLSKESMHIHPLSPGQILIDFLKAYDICISRPDHFDNPIQIQFSIGAFGVMDVVGQDTKFDRKTVAT